MAGFFDQTGPRTRSRIRARLLICHPVFPDDFFALFFTANERKVREALPSASLHPSR